MAISACSEETIFNNISSKNKSYEKPLEKRFFPIDVLKALIPSEIQIIITKSDTISMYYNPCGGYIQMTSAFSKIPETVQLYFIKKLIQAINDDVFYNSQYD